jgi:hypothetical protein
MTGIRLGRNDQIGMGSVMEQATHKNKGGYLTNEPVHTWGVAAISSSGLVRNRAAKVRSNLIEPPRYDHLPIEIRQLDLL